MLYLTSGRKSKAKDWTESQLTMQGWLSGTLWKRLGKSPWQGTFSSTVLIKLSPHRALSLLLHERTLTLVDLAIFPSSWEDDGNHKNDV